MTSSPPSSEWEHGYGGYCNHGCRCDVCREASRTYMQAYRAANKERLNAYQRERRRRKREGG